LALTAAVTGLTGPVIPYTFDTAAADCPAKSTKKDKNVLRGLGLLQLFPSLLQGRADPPPRPPVLLEGAVGSALSAHRLQLFLFDVSQLRTTLLGAGQIIGWRMSRGIARAQEAFHQRCCQHGLGLHEFGFQRAALRLQSADLPAQVIAGVRHVSVVSCDPLIQFDIFAISSPILFGGPSNNLASNRLRNFNSFSNRSGTIVDGVQLL